MITVVSVERLPLSLAQFLKWAGLVGTGGEAKELIRAGLVSLNKKPCLIPGKQLSEGDLVVLCTEEGSLEYIVKTAE